MARGDHIRVPRMGGLYTHHGIDMGDGTIVHFAGEPLQLGMAEVRRDTLEAFAQGAPLEIVRHSGEVRPPEETVETALRHVGARGYRLWRHNCEHFATYCVTGRSESAQVKLIRKVGTALGLTAATAIVLGGALYHVTRKGRGRRMRA